MSDPLNAHSHDNNTILPDYDCIISLLLPDQTRVLINLERLATSYPQSVIANYRYTTDHGPHGPYRLGGVALSDLIRVECPKHLLWSQAEVVSADGYGNRILAHELNETAADPILLCTHSNDQPVTLKQGLIRLVVPSETDNALRQIKWVQTIRLV